MAELIIVYFFAGIGAILDKMKGLQKLKEVKSFSFIYFLILILIFTIMTGTRRDTGGSDYIAYEYFYNFPIGENPWGYDYLFLKLKNIFKIFGFSYNGFLMGISIISHIFIYYILKKYTKFPLIAFFIYLSMNYFWQNYTILRSSLSIFFIWISIDNIKNRKLKKFLFFWIVSCGFHRGAIPLIILYFILRLDLNKFRIALLLLVSTIFSYLLPNILMISNIGKVISYFNEAFGKTPLGFLILIIQKLVLFTYITINKDKMNIDKVKLNVFYNLCFLDLFTSILVFRIPSFTRYSHYYIIGYYVIISEIFGITVKNNLKFKIQNTIILIIFILNFFNTINSDLYSTYNSWLIN